MEMPVAAHAPALSIPAVTHDAGEFSRAPGLSAENRT
jgi:hypothetical protein